MKRTYERIRFHHNWKNLAKDVSAFVKNCTSCKLNKPRPFTMQSLEVSETWLFVTLPNFSYPIATALTNNLLYIHALPRTLITDQGTEYNNNLFKKVCATLNVAHRISTPYHHETLGTVERTHRTLNEYLRAYMSDCRYK